MTGKEWARASTPAEWLDYGTGGVGPADGGAIVGIMVIEPAL